MISFFKRRARKHSPLYPAYHRFFDKVDKYQRQASGWLGYKVEKLTVSSKLGLLALFCLLFSGVSMLALVQAFSKQNVIYHPDGIRVPQHAVDTDFLKIPTNLLTEREYQRMKNFIYVMDSLSHSPSGSRKYDSIQKARPGLLDSAKTLEQLYHQQKK